jgi:dihydropyrimidine dehydrogenase (NAD+) subunit PreA
VGDKFTSGGYSGAAVKPIALHMLTQLAINKETQVPFSGMGGIYNWRDAAEFIALGATSLQVCTAVMHHGYGIIQDMLKGLSDYLDSKGMQSVNELRGKALSHYSSWGNLDLNYRVVAEIDASRCVGCQQCYIACLDGGHQCIHTTKEPCQAYHGESDHAQNVRFKQQPQEHAKNPDSKVHVPFIQKEECIGCNLCSLVCPVGCIEMKEVK